MTDTVSMAMVLSLSVPCLCFYANVIDICMIQEGCYGVASGLQPGSAEGYGGCANTRVRPMSR